MPGQLHQQRDVLARVVKWGEKMHRPRTARSHVQALLTSQKGHLPLDNVVTHWASETEVQHLLDANPDGAKATDWVSPPRRPRRHTPFLAVRIVAATHRRHEQRAGEGGVAAAPARVQQELHPWLHHLLRRGIVKVLREMIDDMMYAFTKSYIA